LSNVADVPRGQEKNSKTFEKSLDKGWQTCYNGYRFREAKNQASVPDGWNFLALHLEN